MISALLWLGLALILEAPLDDAWAKPAGVVISVVVLLLVVFDRYAWRVLPYTISNRPNLRGTWQGYLEYQWPEGSDPQRKECYLAIRQSFSDISVDMHFDISDSESRSAALQRRKGKESLWWSYWSHAKTLHREGNPPHRGAAELTVTMKPKKRLEGDYWTERKTRGRIVVEKHNPEIFDDFETAKAASYK